MLPISKSDRVLVAIVDEAIDIASYRHLIEDPDVGAHAWFEGVTRRMTGDLQTTQLSYEAFRPMAITQMNSIGEETLRQFGLYKVVIVHRLGVVAIGEASLIVGCSAAHRKTIFEALAIIVDRLKADVPIWKKETFVDGEEQWVHPT